jgi:gamma-glutamyltranspeptidase/glutathione hydrolase
MTAPHETYASRFSARPMARARGGMVATANPLATLAGVKILARGGNAVDAVVAAAAAIGVAEPYMSGLAGCGVLVLSRPGARPQALNFLGRAPLGVTAAQLAGSARDSGILSVAVPGNLAGWARVLADHGTRSLGEVLEPAIELAEVGPPMTVFDRQMFEEHHRTLDPEGRRVYLHDGGLPEIGVPVRQPDLARSFQLIGRDGIGAFYDGPLGEALVRDMTARGGLVSRRDLADYPGTLAWTDTLSTSYRGVTVHAPPPPSSAIQILQTLNGMAGWEVGRMAHLGPDHLAVIAEASRAARVDTDRFVGDPAFLAVPVEGLLGAARTESLRAEMRARLEGARVAAPVAGGSGADPRPTGSTTHLAACDATGLAVNITHSLGGGFGSGVVVRGTGIALNNALHWTSGTAGHPNLVEPGKKHEWPVAPLHLYRDGAFWATVGTPGSYGILVTTVQVVSNLIDFGLELQDAIGAPRFRWLDDVYDPLPAVTLRMESRIPEATRRALAARGYAIETQGAWTMRMGGVQGVMREVGPAGPTGWLLGAADPRRNGYAMGW